MTRWAAACVASAALVLVAGAAAQAPTATIVIPGKFYSPSDLSVLVGTTVTWRNEDAGNHTVTANDDSFDSGYITPGGSFALTFAKQGVYAFHCTIHRFMKGVIRVYGLVLNGPHAPVGAGRHVVLTGLAPAGSGSVALERRAAGGRWTAVETRRARADGGYAFVVAANAPAEYRAAVAKATSPVVPVSVYPQVTARIADGRLVVTTAPARPGARVLLQSYVRERFAFLTVAGGRLGAGGRAALSLAGLRRRHVRALVRGSGGWSDGVSPVVLVRP